MVRCRLYTPFLATLLVVFIVGSMMSTNVEVVSRSGWQIISAVFTLHSSGFALGYFISKAMGLSDKICRTNSIEVRGGGGGGAGEQESGAGCKGEGRRGRKVDECVEGGEGGRQVQGTGRLGKDARKEGARSSAPTALR